MRMVLTSPFTRVKSYHLHAYTTATGNNFSLIPTSDGHFSLNFKFCLILLVKLTFI